MLSEYKGGDGETSEVHQPLEVDKDGWIVEEAVETAVNSESSDEPIPPPPPPPPEEEGRGRKKKFAIAGVALVAAAGLGLGLGLGLPGRSSRNAGVDGASGEVQIAGDITDEIPAAEEGAASVIAAPTPFPTPPYSTSATYSPTVKAEEDLTDVVMWADGQDPSYSNYADDGYVDPGYVIDGNLTDDTVLADDLEEVDDAEVDALPLDALEEEPAEPEEEVAEPEEEAVEPEEEEEPEAVDLDDEGRPRPSATYDAVIVGAGWAGIRAAQTLLESGIENFLVLEANDYVGGRAKTINADGSLNNGGKLNDDSNVPFDLGPEWMYDTGGMEETLMDAGYLDLITDGDRYTGIPLETGAFYQTRREDTGELVTEPLYDSDEWMEEIWGGFLQFRDYNLDELWGSSYGEAIDSYIRRWEWTDDESLQFLNLIEDVIETEYTADSSQLDVHEVEFFPPGYSLSTHYTSVPGLGFGNIADEYARPFLMGRTRLNAKVTEIDSDSGIPIVRYVENGVEKAVRARTALVTASLGALKRGGINFVPALPEYKQEVIDAMGFGVVNKCMMSWEDDDAVVWPRDKLWFLLMTPDDETSGRWTQFFNPSALKGRPALTAWVGGDESLEWEERSDEEIVDAVMDNLRAMFPSITRPDNVIISRWGKEENIWGTYSYPVPGRDFYEDAGRLARRMGSVFFAGEATGNGWATAMGAWNTGQAAAENMVRRLGAQDV